MKFYSFLIIALLSTNSLWAQVDSTKIKMIKYTPEYKFKDGLYLQFEDFKNNSPVDKNKIIAPDLDRKDYNFVANVVESKKIKIYDPLGIEVEIKTKNLWGFCSNGNIYININDDFNRLPYIGSLSHLVADKLVYNQNYNTPYGNNYYNSYNPYNPYGNPNAATVEMRQYILDMEKGTITDYTLENVEISLMKDPALYDEFMDLSRKKKKQKMFFYMRKFNERNPLILPAN